MINVAAEQAAKELGLSHSEFLPFAAAWTPVRDGYLAWLAGHEATGARFDMAEQWLDMPLGSELTLIGKIDRMDRLPDGERAADRLQDRAAHHHRRAHQERRWKTRSWRSTPRWCPTTRWRAAYVNLGEKEPTRTYEQPDIVALRDALIDGILQRHGPHCRGRAAAGAGRRQGLRLLRGPWPVPQRLLE